MIRSIILAILLLAVAVAAIAQPSDFQKQEVYRIRVQNRADGLVQVSLNEGRSWACVGRVTAPANARIPGFAASSYTPSGTVAATATHGIRIKTGQDTTGGYGKAQAPLMFSITPMEFSATPKGYGGHIPRSAAVYTDIHSGRSIFRNFSPYVTNPVFLERNRTLQPLPEDYIPRVGDTYVIQVMQPVNMPSSIEFENRAGGKVTAHYPDSKTEVITEVQRPVRGTGRYDGTTFTGVGAINTNHGGVITISTAPVCPPGTREGGPVETRGGFMIQPYYHVMDQGETAPQVMVIGPKDRTKPVLEGTPPLFGGFINLAWSPKQPQHSYRAQVRIDDGDWQDVPELVGRIDNSLTPEYLSKKLNRSVTAGVTAIRLLFPTHNPALLTSELKHESDDYTARALKYGAKPARGTITLTTPQTPAQGSLVNFLIDGTLGCMCSTRPYNYAWDTTKVANGYHIVEIVTVSADGNEVRTEEKVVFVKN